MGGSYYYILLKGKAGILRQVFLMLVVLLLFGILYHFLVTSKFFFHWGVIELLPRVRMAGT